MRIDVWSDFTDPACYLLYLSLRQLQNDYDDLSLFWRALPLAVPLGDAEALVLEALVYDRHGLKINPGPAEIDSEPALIAAKVVESHQPGAEYHDALFHAYWQEARDISHPIVLRTIGEAVGIAPEDFDRDLDDPLHQTKVTHDGLVARQYGITTVPTLVVENKYRVSGVQTYATLAKMIEQWQQTER